MARLGDCSTRGVGGVLNLFLGLARGRSRSCFLLVWHAVVWTIWRYRSDFIFSGKVILDPHLVDLIKFTSCKCFFGSRPGQSYSFYE